MLILKLNHVSKRAPRDLKIYTLWCGSCSYKQVSVDNVSADALVPAIVDHAADFKFNFFNVSTAFTMYLHEYAVNLNTLRPKLNGRHFADDIFKRIFLNENILVPIKISLKFVPKGPINNIPALVQVMAWRRPGDKPLSEPMMVNSTTHICVTRPQWVNHSSVQAGLNAKNMD